MSEPEDTDVAHLAPIIVIGVAKVPGQPDKMGYVVQEENLAAVVESGTVCDMLKAIGAMMDHPSILQAVQDQDLMDRMGVK